jgi:hypothetical protein
MREDCWQRAAECAARANKAVDSQTREFFIGLRDAWISIANRSELIEAMGGPGELAEQQSSSTFPAPRAHA